MSRAGILFFLLLVAGFAALILIPRRAGIPDVPFTAAGVTLHTYTESGDLSWEVYAIEGEVAEDQGELRQVEVRFVHANASSLTATADTLVRGDVESVLSGDVRVEREDGLSLATESLTWNERQETLESGAIEVSVRDATVVGQAFEYDLQADRARIYGGVSASIEEESLEVLAESAEDVDGETLRLTGGVEATFPEGTLVAERAEVRDAGIMTSGDVTLRLDLAQRQEQEESIGP